MIRIIGCGNMGGAIAHVLASSGNVISVYDKHTPLAQKLSEEASVAVSKTPLDGLSADDFLILAIKPQDFQEALKELKGLQGIIVVSVMMGISTTQLKEAFPGNAVVRFMPNLAVRYGRGLIAAAEDPLLGALKDKIGQTFSPLGSLHWISEKNFDAVTALTGSGPAFVFAMIQAMTTAAVTMGFSTTEGFTLVKEMIEGAMVTLEASGAFPEELISKITSPGGTTIAGLRTFEEKGVRSGIIETFLSAYERSKKV